MDWADNPFPQLWAMPKNIKRKAKAKTPTGEEFTWTSKYSSIIVANFDCATSDGLNSKGLTANILWLAPSEYPKKSHKDGYFPMSMSIWAQYILDSCATVKDAVIAMNNIYIQTANIPGGVKADVEAKCHLSVGDKKGNSAVFEYIDEHLHVFTNVDIDTEAYNHSVKKYSKDQMRVMTNDPMFDTQIASLTYWDELNKKYEENGNPALLPGSNWSLSRFVRATYFTRQLPEKIDKTLALARLSAVINNTAQPIIKNENLDTPDLSRTQYSSLADQKSLQYFYRSGYGPFLIWIDLKEIDFSKLKKKQAFIITLNEDGVFTKGKGYGSGNVTKYLEAKKMFKFLKAK
jgi:choloylglycine hydrolase